MESIYPPINELLDRIIDEWCIKEISKCQRRNNTYISKLSLKNELGKAIGLGTGQDPNSAAKGIYRYCSGETPLSVEKALMISRHIKNYELIQWIGWNAGTIMIPREIIHHNGIENPKYTIREILKFVKLAHLCSEKLFFATQRKPNPAAIKSIENSFFKVVLQAEKCRFILKKFIEKGR